MNDDALRRRGLGLVKASATLRQKRSPPSVSAEPRYLFWDGRMTRREPLRWWSRTRMPCKVVEPSVPSTSDEGREQGRTLLPPSRIWKTDGAGPSRLRRKPLA